MCFPEVYLRLKVEKLGGSWMGLCGLHVGMGVLCDIFNSSGSLASEIDV